MMNIKAIIEMPKGTSYKYEVNKETGALRIDRQLNRCVPYNYGFVPDTMCSDGDPLDIFVISNEPINPLTEVEVSILGVFECTDNGVSDNKLISVLVGSNPRESDIDQYVE
jgi:inorganic pyrophosphatase